ncbi:MAG TPA: DUF167 domain-containing protein [Nitrospira sp.]|nr:DUF167 domain-containing protein [Nitrospira sp.]
MNPSILVGSLPAIARDSERGALLAVHVQPGSSRTECVGIHGDAIKIRLAARPIDGAANDELIRFIADRCAVPRAHVQICAGSEARRKRLCVKEVSAQVLLARLLPQNGKEMEQV